MARITVEDCLDKIPNRFQLVLAATYRARMLSQGHAPKVESKNKPGVTALREIAAGLHEESPALGLGTVAASRIRVGCQDPGQVVEGVGGRRARDERSLE